MNWLVGSAFVIPVVLINGFLLVMYPAIAGLGGPFGTILACGFFISLIPGFMALLIQRLSAPPPPAQKVPGQQTEKVASVSLFPYRQRRR